MPASLSFNLINLGGLKFGKHVSFSYSPGSQRSAESPWATASELPLPFQDLNANPHPISLLSWHTSLSDFVGRSDEMSLLGEWAKSDIRISVMVLSGTGGSGKSRLAAEFGRAMRRQGWSAGFVDLEKNTTFRLYRTGGVLLIDYPEEHLEFVRALLDSLARSEYPTKVRVLLITRRSFVQCADLFKQSRCEDIVHGAPLLLQPIDRKDLYRLYTSAVDRAAERLQTIPLPLSEEVFAQWVTASSENNLPLFVTAAAAHAALYPSDIVIRYTGKQVVAALIDRELRRLEPTSLSLGLPPQGIGRVLAIATLAGGIQAATLPNMRALPALGLGDADLEKALDQAGLLVDGIIHPLKPDIIGAALTAQVLSSDDQVSEWVWFALTCNGNIEASCSRLARMIHDERLVFDDHGSIIARHFANAIGRSFPRLAKVCKYFQSADIPHSLAGIEETVWRGFARLGPGAVKALALNNLALCLINRGKHREAFTALRDAQDLHAREPELFGERSQFEQGLRLVNLGRMFSQVADDDHAIEILKQAIRCIEPYAESGELHAIANLSGALDLLSRSLYRKRKKGEALRLAMRAAELAKRAAEADPGAYEGEHVFRLVNIATLRNNMGNPRGALAAIKQAEAMARRLVDRDRGRYEDRLANVLLNKGAILTTINRFSDAVVCAAEGQELYRAINSATQDGFVLELVTVSINYLKAAILLCDPDVILDACEKIVPILSKGIITDEAVRTKDWIFAAAARAMAAKYGNAEGLIQLGKFLDKHPDLASEVPLTPATFSQAITADLWTFGDKDTNQRNEGAINPVDIASLLGRALADAQSRARPPA